MTELAVDMTDSNEPSVEDITAAREAARALSKVSPAARMVRFRVAPKDEAPAGDPIDIPRNVFKVIVDLLVQVGNGNAVQLVPVQAELTTQQAADLLNVSRPHLIKLINTGEIAHRMVGTHRKVPAREVWAYQDRTSSRRRTLLASMTVGDQEAGMYDDEPIKPREP